MTAERQPDELNALKGVVSEFLERYKSIESELELLKDSQKELVEEFKERLDMKTLQAAMRTVKIEKKVNHRDTYETFLELLKERENL
jgi:uncharacterized protein (UPF0335 family)